MSSTRSEVNVHGSCTQESTENQAQFRANGGITPLFYANEPGPHAPAFLGPPTDILEHDDECRLFRSTCLQLQENQLQRGGKVKSSQHRYLQSPSRSNRRQVWSYLRISIETCLRGTACPCTNETTSAASWSTLNANCSWLKRRLTMNVDVCSRMSRPVVPRWTTEVKSIQRCTTSASIK
ncbi:hypothetical protein HPB51_014885 [Rhipicephalus microplus]|uniref:Uncharacterized protein n=1 Tax=Rhipicephalus microplus TaxID=6941 RepID=A0A9J6EGP8_RHIMP|nr:hypothetical protein HPB51_014885 [Rhipicephalus microplus]